MTWILKHNAPRPTVPRAGAAQAQALRQQVRPVYEALRARGYNPGAAAPMALGEVLAREQRGDGPMNRLPIIHPDSSHATAVAVSRGELVLEPVRILDGRWCVRRDGRLVPADPDKFDAFVMERGEVTDGYHTWKRLAHFLRDRGVRVPGDFDAADVALKAAHWRAYRCAVESLGGRRGDAGVEATVARVPAPSTASYGRAA